MKFVLWLYIVAYDGPAIHSETYSTEESCRKAGEALVHGFSDAKRTSEVRFVCTSYFKVTP